MEPYGALWSLMEPYGALWSPMESCGALQSPIGPYGPWSKVVHYTGNRVRLKACSLSEWFDSVEFQRAECCSGFYGPECKTCTGGFQTPCYGKGTVSKRLYLPSKSFSQQSDKHALTHAHTHTRWKERAILFGYCLTNADPTLLFC